MRRRRKKEIMLPHTVTTVRGENKFAPMSTLVGRTHNLVRMTAVTFSTKQEVGPETAETASVCLLSLFLFNAT